VNISNSRLLRGKISLFSGTLSAAAHGFWTHPDFPNAYREYICHTHSIIRATVPLMRAAIGALQQPRYADDPLAQPMLDYLVQHAEEETGHDNWILDDGEAMGMSRESVLQRQPAQFASHIVGAQYYWIHHYHPVAFLGYIAVMEGEPATTEFFEDVARRNNLPNKAISSFLYHTKIDPRHKADLDRLLDRLELKPDDNELISLSAIRTIGYLTEMLKAVNRSVPPEAPPGKSQEQTDVP
jgi:hypothetical protein